MSVCVEFRVLDLLLDERVLQSLVDADALGRVQHQGAIQQVLQLHHLLPLVLGQSLASDHVRQQVFGGVDGAHHRHLLLMARTSKRNGGQWRRNDRRQHCKTVGHVSRVHKVRTPHPFCYFVYFDVQEVQILIEVLVFEESFPDHLREDKNKKKTHGCISLERCMERQHVSSRKEETT